MKSKFSQLLIRSLATKHKLTAQQVEAIVKSTFEFQYDVMTNKCKREMLLFPTTRILGFGTFVVPENKKRKLFINKSNGIIGLKQKNLGDRDNSRGNTGRSIFETNKQRSI